MWLDAFDLQFPVPTKTNRSQGLHRARLALQAYLAGKKAVIWCFAAREFTESNGWSLVPFSSVAKPAGTTP
ncbi:MAG: hypothetical protein O3A92_12245 [Verrucomicrobia bacterium]|nr:hypothetical protein [Verrucomicrobiota bacterium]